MHRATFTHGRKVVVVVVGRYSISTVCLGHSHACALDIRFIP